VTRGDTGLIAFHLPSRPSNKMSWKMMGAHTDSPCLRLKPNSFAESAGYLQAGIEVYGGMILSTWFDRDLSLAGKICYESKAGEFNSLLVDFERPIALIPNLAIHLNREANENRTINKQNEMPPILSLAGEKKNQSLQEIVLSLLKSKYGIKDAKTLLSHDLRFYDTQAPRLLGLNLEFMTGARFDNLLSCYVGLKAFFEASPDVPCLVTFTDHEEVGSTSAEGADGNFLRSVIKRITESRFLSDSLFISADNAHGVHPNYKDLHDPAHRPLLNAGPVIKCNANLRYATSCETEAKFRLLCSKAGVPVQVIAVRADKPCGSTIGPMTAANMGIPTVDIGVPTWAMHSIRESAGVKDAHYLYQVLKTFFNTKESI
jgi:aspartyl aminopeptidase